MSAEQTQFPLRISGAIVTTEEIDALCEHLVGRGWVTARTLTEELPLDDRHIREIAEHSDGRILSGPGCPGYKLFDGAASVADADAAASRLESQAKRMLTRAGAIRRRYHRYAHA